MLHVVSYCFPPVVALSRNCSKLNPNCLDSVLMMKNCCQWSLNCCGLQLGDNNFKCFVYWIHSCCHCCAIGCLWISVVKNYDIYCFDMIGWNKFHTIPSTEVQRSSDKQFISPATTNYLIKSELPSRLFQQLENI